MEKKIMSAAVFGAVSLAAAAAWQPVYASEEDPVQQVQIAETQEGSTDVVPEAAPANAQEEQTQVTDSSMPAEPLQAAALTMDVQEQSETQAASASLEVDGQTDSESLDAFDLETSKTQDGKEEETETLSLLAQTPALMTLQESRIQEGWNAQGTSYLVNGTALTGEQEIDGNFYYFNEKGIMLKGQQCIQNIWKCFDRTTGIRKTGLVYLDLNYQPDGAKTVYYDENGAMVYGKVDTAQLHKYFQSGSGAMVTNTMVTVSGKNYYYDNKGNLYAGQKQVNGSWKYFDPDQGCAAAVGFVTIPKEYEPNGAKTVYYDTKGNMLYGQQKIGSYWYCFDKGSGEMFTGLTSLSKAYEPAGAKTVYYNEKGQMLYGLQKLPDGSTRYFDTGSGAMQTNMMKSISGKQYYFGSNGKLYYGQKQVNGYWKYFDPAQGGAAAVGFVTIPKEYEPNGAKTVYYDAKGNMLYGQQKIGSYWYCFDKGSGEMFTGLTSLSKAYEPAGAKTVYYNENGQMLYGMQKLPDGSTRYFDTGSGAMQTNVMKSVGGKQYYFGSNGKLYYGQKQVNGYWKYFDPAQGGAAAVGLVTIPKEYESDGAKTVCYDANGNMLYGQQHLADGWYCFDLSSGKMFTGLTSLSKAYEPKGAKTVYYSPEGIMQYGLQELPDATIRYFDPATGAMLTNTKVKVDGTTWYINAKGIASTESSGPILAAPSVSGALQVIGTLLCDQDGDPVMLRGVSTHGLAWFPQYVNEECFAQLKNEWGCNVVRLALYTAEYNGYCTGGNQSELKKLVQKGIDAAKKNDMYVIIDWHVLNDQDPNTYKEQAKAFFKEIAQANKDSCHILYEICNEPNGSATWSSIQSYAKEVIPVIRAQDPDAVVLVGTPNWCQFLDQAAARPLSGFDNIMYTCHFYAGTHQESLRTTLKNAVAAGLPVFVSEFGISDASGNGALNQSQGEAWIRLLEENNISYVMWNLANKAESSALISSSCTKTSGFKTSDLTESGKWLLSILNQYTEYAGTGYEPETEPTTPSTPSDSSNPSASDPSSSSGNQQNSLSVQGSMVNSWPAGQDTCAQFSFALRNETDNDVKWSVKVVFDQPISMESGWSASYSIQSNVLTFSGVSYNDTLKSGASIDGIGIILKAASLPQISRIEISAL